MMKLYTYFRLSASYRIRIALHLKGLNADHVPVHLVKGEQVGADYHAIAGNFGLSGKHLPQYTLTAIRAL